MTKLRSAISSHRRLLTVVCICALSVGLGGCSFGDFLISLLNAIGMAQDTQARISGASYFKLDSKDSQDGSTASPSYICVVHDPGCGISGNSGKDQFFLNRILPPLTTVTHVDFTAIAPDGLPATDGGGIGGYGSYGARLESGVMDGSKPIVVSWNNACQGVYGGKKLYYLMSFVLNTKKGIDLIDPSVAPSTTAPACGPPPASSTPPPVTASGWEGTVKVCNPAAANETLHLVAAFVPAATGATTNMTEDIPVTLANQGSGVWTGMFKTKQTYKPGTWKITAAQVKNVTGPLPGPPLTSQLPGGVGAPVLDFTGGTCAIQ